MQISVQILTEVSESFQKIYNMLYVFDICTSEIDGGRGGGQPQSVNLNRKSRCFLFQCLMDAESVKSRFYMPSFIKFNLD